MTTCRQARILTWATRSLAVVATGALAWYVAQPIAQHFGSTLSDPMQIGIGGIFALIALFVSKRALDFTEDCMTVPDALARAAHGSKPVSCRKRACQFHIPDDGATDSSKNATTNGAAPDSKCGSDGKIVQPQCLSTTVADHESMKVAVQTADGTTTVTVTINGVSSSKFKDKQSGLRKKLEGVGGIKWENPKNIGNGSREMVGRITDTARREAVVARLQALAASV